MMRKDDGMELRVTKIEKSRQEEIEIRCHEVTDQVREIVDFVRTRQGKITGIVDGKQIEVPVVDILYIETVDNRSFLYGAKQVYETKQKLYELEEQLRAKYFLRVSRSVLINLMKVEAIKPALNGRLIALLSNGEELVISRKYVADMKKTLKGGI